MVSCTESYDDWADPMTNEQEDTKSVALSVSQASAVDYAELTEDSVKLFNSAVTVADKQQPATTTYKVTLWNADKTSSVVLDASSTCKVAAADLQAAVVTLYGKRPVAREIPMDITAYVNVGGQSIKAEGSSTITVTLTAPFIASAYYLIGDMNGWSADALIQFTHSGKDVYEDPVFTATFTVTAENQYWKIIPQTCLDAGGPWAIENQPEGVVGIAVDGDSSPSGNLITDQAKAGKIEAPGLYRMTINMMDYTYEIVKLEFSEFIYEIGNDSGWSTSNPLRGANFDGKYQGYYYLDGEFKFKPNADNWDNDYEYVSDGVLTTDGGPNIPGVTGFYQINVDAAAMTYSLQKVDVISIIGDFNGWGGDVDMTYNTTNKCWEATATVTAGGLKFRMNHDWTISWGGANGDGNNYGDLTANGGANLNVAEGTYLFQLYISYEGNNKLVLTKQ